MKAYFHSPASEWLLITVFLLFSACAAATEVNIYLSPSGSDSNDGLSSTKPLASLQRALDVAVNNQEENAGEIRILVAEGVYLKQTATTKGLLSGQTLYIRAIRAKTPRPCFDGGGEGGTWLSLTSAAGRATRIAVYGLEIANYETAISFNGNRNDMTKWNGENDIHNNVFRNIGQIARKDSKPSTAAIRLVNSRGNSITHNKFIDIRNREHCGVLHAVYVAHNSTHNVIKDNTFKNTCGDAIRFRDSSDDNVVTNNTFVDAWDKAPVSEWYCDDTKRGDCTKATGECPSLNNLIVANKIISHKPKGIPLTLTYGPKASLVCGMAGSDARFIVR